MTYLTHLDAPVTGFEDYELGAVYMIGSDSEIVVGLTGIHDDNGNITANAYAIRCAETTIEGTGAVTSIVFGMVPTAYWGDQFLGNEEYPDLSGYLYAMKYEGDEESCALFDNGHMTVDSSAMGSLTFDWPLASGEIAVYAGDQPVSQEPVPLFGACAYGLTHYGVKSYDQAISELQQQLASMASELDELRKQNLLRSFLAEYNGGFTEYTQTPEGLRIYKLCGSDGPDEECTSIEQLMEEGVLEATDDSLLFKKDCAFCAVPGYPRIVSPIFYAGYNSYPALYFDKADCVGVVSGSIYGVSVCVQPEEGYFQPDAHDMTLSNGTPPTTALDEEIVYKDLVMVVRL